MMYQCQLIKKIYGSALNRATFKSMILSTTFGAHQIFTTRSLSFMYLLILHTFTDNSMLVKTGPDDNGYVAVTAITVAPMSH